MLHDRSLKSRRINRLCKEAHKSLFLIEFFAQSRIRGKCINRQIGTYLLYPLKSLNTVHSGHHVIKKNNIEPVFLDLIKRFISAGGSCNKYLGSLKKPLYDA